MQLRLCGTLALGALVLAGCAGRSPDPPAMRLAAPPDVASVPASAAAPTPATNLPGETDLDREWRRYGEVEYGTLPPPGPPARRFTFGFGSGTPRPR